MRPRFRLKLRTSVILMLFTTVLVTLIVVGSGILAIVLPRVTAENEHEVQSAAQEIAARIELYLHDLETHLQLVGNLYGELTPALLEQELGLALEPLLSAIYIVDDNGRLAAIATDGPTLARTSELLGIDLSAHPFYRDVMKSEKPIWSDKHISAVTGRVTLGLAVPLMHSQGVVIAELPLEKLLQISRVTKGRRSLDHWIIDRRGEIVSDTLESRLGKINVAHLPIVEAGLARRPTPQHMTFDGTNYHAAAAYSEILGWLFVARMPSGLKNPRVREVVFIILAAISGSALVGLLLAPLWSRWITSPLIAVTQRAHRIAGGKQPESWPHSGISEIETLSSDLAQMAQAIAQREEDLRRLNDELEARVTRRTAELNETNAELTEAMAAVRRAQSELIRSEKLAALGRLVAGLAHEMNTPLGNGRLAATTLSEKLVTFEAALADGLRRTQLDRFVEGVRATVEIVDLNLGRVGNLVSSLRDVAADRTTSRRRHFRLKEVVDEVLITLSPMLKRHGARAEVVLDVDDELTLDSYPGELGQVLTNLIENCVTHAFRDMTTGHIRIVVSADGPEHVAVHLRDNGAGMPEDVARRAFDPFYTTAMGRGGTGLGLFIVHNAVTNVLAGTITLASDPGKGTSFDLRIPTIAPTAGANHRVLES